MRFNFFFYSSSEQPHLSGFFQWIHRLRSFLYQDCQYSSSSSSLSLSRISRTLGWVVCEISRSASAQQCHLNFSSHIDVGVVTEVGKMVGFFNAGAFDWKTGQRIMLILLTMAASFYIGTLFGKTSSSPYVPLEQPAVRQNEASVSISNDSVNSGQCISS